MSSDSPTPPDKRSWPRRLLNRVEVDQAVFYSIAAAGWQLLAGPITAMLIVACFTPQTQGFYYTFWSIIALQMLFELSLPGVILTMASHEWGKLARQPDGTIAGDEQALSRLQSLSRQSLAIYAVAAILFALLIGAGGFYFFSRDADSDAYTWCAPWIALVVFSALAFWLSPLLSLLEGCNQVKEVYRFQFIRAVIGNGVMWCCIPLGIDLWIPAILTIVRLICELALIAGRYRRFFTQLVARPRGETIHWRKDVWPFQWRTGLKAIGLYAGRHLQNLVIWETHGKAAAGRIGMTWQILASLQLACYSWVRTRSPTFGMLIARRDFAELDRVFFRVTRIAFLAACLGTVSFLAALITLDVWAPQWADRLIEPLPTALFCVAIICGLLAECAWVFVHAHQRSPLLFYSLLIVALQPVLVIWWGAEYGVMGIAASSVVINGILSLPLGIAALRSTRKQERRG